MAHHDLVLPIALVIAAALLVRFELASYRTLSEGGDVDGPFVYRRGRLIRRMFGAAILVALAGTFVVWDGFRPRTIEGAATVVTALFLEVAALFGLALHDLAESGRRAPRQRDRLRSADVRALATALASPTAAGAAPESPSGDGAAATTASREATSRRRRKPRRRPR